VSFLLDSNTFIDYMRRGPTSPVTAKLLTTPPESIYFCSVVLAELIYGAVRSGPAYEVKNRSLIAGLRAQFSSVPFNDDAAEEYGKIRAHLASLGQMIGANDLMIAAIALANGLTLVTHNTEEFSRVPGLRLEDWQ
jgi:tRNA(fMet)-specific endonuclease VapC